MRRLIVLLAALALGSFVMPAPASAAPTSTIVVVIRPVTTHGDPVAGWHVHRQQGIVDCGGASRSAVDDGITTCYPSFEYLPACWRSHHHTVLCVRDATEQQLVRIHYRGRYPHVVAPARPSPQAQVLGTGQTCLIRVGGAWGIIKSHPHWFGFYSCDNGALWGPPRGDGIGRQHHPWWVHLVRPDDSVAVRKVAVAYEAGTA
jgi:hypothetical protein